MAKKVAPTEKTTLPEFKAVITDNVQLPGLAENWDYELLNAETPEAEKKALEAVKKALLQYAFEEFTPETTITGGRFEVLTHTLKHSGKLKPDSRNLFLFTGTTPGGELLITDGQPKHIHNVAKAVRFRSVFTTGANSYILQPTPAAKRFVIHLSF